jgi:hypothetical protein
VASGLRIERVEPNTVDFDGLVVVLGRADADRSPVSSLEIILPLAAGSAAGRVADAPQVNEP